MKTQSVMPLLKDKTISEKDTTKCNKNSFSLKQIAKTYNFHVCAVTRPV